MGMLSFTELLLWGLVAFGITNGISNSKMFNPIWERWVLSPSSYVRLMGELLVCPMCLGFWVGAALGWWWVSPTSIILLDMFLSSGVCWILHIMTKKRV